MLPNARTSGSQRRAKTRENAQGVLRRPGNGLFTRHAAQVCEHVGDSCQFGRFVPPAGKPFRRNVWRIRFEHVRLRRQFLHQAPDPARARPGQCTAETKRETEIQILLRLLSAGIEGMGDPGQRTHAAQLRQHCIVRTAHVQQYRQPVIAGKTQLFMQKMFLARPIEAGHEKIEPDFADGDQAWIPDPDGHASAQEIEFTLTGLIDAQRMDAQRVDDASIACGQRADRIEIRTGHRRNDDCAQTGRKCPRKDIGTIRVELGGIQMTVGVNQHDGHDTRNIARPDTCADPAR